MNDFWPEGPRDWSPRQTSAWKHLETLKAAIPPEMLVEEGGGYKVGQHLELVAKAESRSARIGLIVKIGDAHENVWICSDGLVFVDLGITMLLCGNNSSYPHLAGRWPWPGSYGPPRHEDPLGRHS